jgi:cobalt-zinc-cadmium efflux system membrane fusion protein
MRGLFRLASATFGLQLLGVLAAFAHEGHDHGAPPPPVSSTVAPRMEASSNDFELVAIAGQADVTIYLDTFRGNEPVQGAAIDVDAGGETLRAEAVGEGVYLVKPKWAGSPGSHDLAITIDANGLLDVLVGTLVIAPAEVPPPQPDQKLSGFIPPALAASVEQRIRSGDASLWLVAGLAFLAGAAVALLFRRRKAATLAVLAIGVMIFDSPAQAAQSSIAVRDMAQRLADGTVFVPKPTQRVLAIRTLFTSEENHPGTVELPARVIPDPNASGYVQSSMGGRLMPPQGGFPRLGAKVEAGQVLAVVEPVIGAADLNSQEAQLREVEQEISLIETKLKRYTRLKDVVAESAVEDAEIALAGLKARREVLGNLTAEPEKLVAPVSGVIAAVNAVAGQIAEPSAVIFRIIDPARYWVEALSYQALPIAGGGEGRLSDGRVLKVSYRGTGLADQNQAVPVQFEIEGEAEMLRAGQLLTVLAQTEVERKGIAVPRTAVIRGSNGQPIVYDHISAENFRPREVRVEPLDGERVLIVSGVGAGSRIVSQGAELLNQIR